MSLVYSFDSHDIQNLLMPGVFFAGAMFDGTEDQYDRFVEQGIWENGWGEDKKYLSERCASIKKGDIILVKKLMGQGSKQMTLRCAGVVLGRVTPSNRNKFYVAWALPEIEVIVPLREVSTISTALPFVALRDEEKEIVRKCMVRFLRFNLSNIPTRSYF